MVFRITSTKRRRAEGLTLVETLVASAISTVIFGLVATSFIFNAKSMVGLSNYVDLDKKSRSALDIMSKQIRRAHWLQECNTNYLTFADFDETPGNLCPLTFQYDPTARTLIRIKNGVADPKPLLTECDFLQFGIFQRNPKGGSYDQYPTAVATNCKMVQLTWICSRKVQGTLLDTESVQSAKIVIRRR